MFYQRLHQNIHLCAKQLYEWWTYCPISNHVSIQFVSVFDEEIFLKKYTSRYY